MRRRLNFEWQGYYLFSKTAGEGSFCVSLRKVFCTMGSVLADVLPKAMREEDGRIVVFACV